MKNLQNLFLSIVFILGSFLSNAQDLTIRKASKKASFKKDQLLDVFYTHENQDPDCNYCNHKNFKGYFQKETADSLVFKIIELHQYQTGDVVSIHKEMIFHDGDKELNIAKNGVFKLTNLGSEAKANRKQNSGAVAGLLIIGSAVTGLGCLITKGESRKNLGIFSLAQLGVGISFGIMSYQKTYSLKPSDIDSWGFN